MRGIDELFDDIAALVGVDHAITFTLLLHPAIVGALDAVRGPSWRTRSDGGLASVPLDDDIDRLFGVLVLLAGRLRAVELVGRLDWRAARALDRLRGPGWREAAV